GWQGEGLADVEIIDGIATVRAEGVRSGGLLFDPDAPAVGDSYTRVVINGVTGRGGWAAGLAVRVQPNGDHYRLLINDRGEWQFAAVVDGEVLIVRDWRTHPAIAVGSTDFEISILANGPIFSIFYEGQQLGQLDDDTITGVGSAGLAIQSANAVGSEMTARFDELSITIPFEIPDGRVFPDRIVPGSPRITAQELARRGVMPTGGQLAWEIPESFIEAQSPGVSRLPLVESTAFSRFAMGTRATVNAAAPGPVGCGLLVGNQSDTSYIVAFVDTDGGYGISQREGDRFEPGLYGENPAWSVADGVELVLVADGEMLHLFVDQVHAGTVPLTVPDGQVGNVIINFEPVSASCQFRDTWVWQLDEAAS
ncbi:MAG: hypothetical protein ACOCYT_05080, partial [Chloroflexota bacterium]